jgi:hypothetical protein
MKKVINNFLKTISDSYQVMYEGYDDVYDVSYDELVDMYEEEMNIDVLIELISEKFLIDKEDLINLWKDKKDEEDISKSIYGNSCMTITFGDQAENHVGMEKIGDAAECGLTVKELEKSYKKMKKNGVNCELVYLNGSLEGIEGSDDVEEAVVLIIRNGVEEIGVNADEMYKELTNFDWDKKAIMYGRVVNKNARHNVCFYEKSQEPDYEKGKGRIVAYDDVKLTQKIRNGLPGLLGEKVEKLAGEGNFYYDVSKCGIGFHGDAERKKVVALRLGQTLPLHYQWFRDSVPVGDRIMIELAHGDMYAMSEKAVGFDWKKKKIFTLRHATGCDRFTKI